MPSTIYIYISEFDQSKGVRERELSTETIKVFSKAQRYLCYLGSFTVILIKVSF